MIRKQRNSYSRLSARERKRYTRQTVLFTFLTLLLVGVIVLWGIPALVKVAIFLGDLRSSSQPIQDEDTSAPSPPVLQPLPDATHSASLQIQGFSEEGSTVIVFVNNTKQAETVTETNGEFLFHSVNLDAGENRIQAVAVDSRGNESQPSSLQRVVHDAEAPALELTSPKNRASFFGSQERTIQVKGSTEPGSVLRINGNIIILSQDGSFASKLTLSPGENEIAVLSTDRAGNEKVIRHTVTYEE